MATDTSTVAGSTSPAKGHPIGFWFFFWGEFAERCSYYGMRAILAKYMTEQLGVDKSDAGTLLALFIAACYFLPLLGGYLADNFFGKYWTIVGFSVPYVIGQLIVGIDNKYVVLGALALLAMGSGVIKPNISTLMGLTYDQQRPGREQLRSDAFSWFYLAINIGALLSQLAVPWLRTKYDYQTAFFFPAGLMILALAVFALGKRFYAKEMIEKKVLGTIGEHIPDGTTVTGLPIKYKIVLPEEKATDRKLKLQTLGRIGSLFFLIMFFWAIFDQSTSTWIFFADTYMDLHLFGLEVTADQIQFVNALFIVAVLPMSVVFFNFLAKQGIKIRPTDKMVVGFMLTALSMFVLGLSGFLAGKKQDAVKVTFKEGEVILPVGKGDLKDVKLAGAEFGEVHVVAADAKYNAEKKKWEVTDGAITFHDGGILTIKDGRIDFDKSRGVFAKTAIAPSGALETKFKNGDYAMGADKLIIGENGSVEIKKGEKLDVPKDKEMPKVTLEDTEWVKPNERVTAWWQVLCFFIITLGEIMISVTGLELAFVAAPPTMKSFVTGCWLVTVGMANLLINAPITRLYQHMEPGPYFSMLGGALVLVTIIFIPLAIRFNRGMLAAKAAEEEQAAKEGNTESV